MLNISSFTISSGDRMPNCTLLTKRTGALESVIAILWKIQSPSMLDLHLKSATYAINNPPIVYFVKHTNYFQRSSYIQNKNR